MAWPGRISRHDIVYHSPPADPMQGLPIGNGDLGALLWCEGSRVIVVLNKCDLWDDAEFTHFHIGQHGAEEQCTSLKHAGRLILDFKLPVFDSFYLADFEARISLADARVTLDARGPLGRVSLRAFIGHDQNLLWLDVHSDLKEKIDADVTFERIGSRTFSRWYSQINRDPSIGLGGTRARHDQKGRSVDVTQKVTGGRFAAGCAVVADRGLRIACSTDHSRAASMRIGGPAAKRFQLVATATSPRSDDPLPELRATLKAARRAGPVDLVARHRRAWKAFWLRSLIECGDDYLDSLWHVTMYYLNSSQRGRDPGRFINGLWGWSRDVQPWNFYFHWNQQTLYFPLNAAGHHDLVASYLDFRFRTLPRAKADARRFFQSDGAFVCDLSDHRGYNSASEHGNHTPVAEIALDFWRQYRYSRDRQFLLARALPYMLEAARFFESRFERGPDGLFHPRPGTALEGWVVIHGLATEIACGRALFAAVLQALDEAGQTHPCSAHWRDLLENMAPIPLAKAQPGLLTRDARRGWTLGQGLFKGQPVRSNDLLAVGYRPDQKRMVISLTPQPRPTTPMPDVHDLVPLIETTFLPQDVDMQYQDVFPEAEYLSVFPTGLIGLADKGSRLFDAAANTARLYAPGLGGYDRTAVVLARLGCGAEAWRVISLMPRRWQHYVNGFGHYNWGMKADQALRFRVNYPVDIDSPQGSTKLPVESWPFRHMGMESMSVMCCAMNECLLQSHDGVIRVAPAMGPNQAARFTLHAAGGFVVSSEIVAGMPAWIHIASRSGQICRAVNPWPVCHVFRSRGKPERTSSRIVALPTAVGESILLAPRPDALRRWRCTPLKHRPNDKPKAHGSGRPMLGLPRMF